MQKTDARSNESPFAIITDTLEPSPPEAPETLALQESLDACLRENDRYVSPEPGDNQEQRILTSRDVKNDVKEIADYLKGLTVLFVEDENDICEQAREFLSRLVGVLLISQNGAEGLEAWRLYKPDIIITDIRMPVMDGLAMLQEIRGVDPVIPVIIISAFEESDYLKRSIDLGVSGYVIKPVNTARFTKELQKCASVLLTEAKLAKAHMAAAKTAMVLRKLINAMNAGLSASSIRLSWKTKSKL